MRAMQERIPGIVSLSAGFSKGWVGPDNQVVMTVDFPSKAEFDVYMQHPYHTEHIDKLGTEFFDRSTFVAAQVEI